MAFEFEEVLEIYCRMRMRVPKTNQQHIREQTILSVVIPIEPINIPGQPQSSIHPEYVGSGTIKKVLIKSGDPLLTVIFQLDIRDPLDRNKR